MKVGHYAEARCQKGERECSYPNTGTLSDATRETSKSKTTLVERGLNPPDDFHATDGKFSLSDVLEENEIAETDDVNKQSATEDCSKTVPPLTTADRRSTVASASSPKSFRQPVRSSRTDPKHFSNFSLERHARWNTLPNDIQKYLTYHRDNLSCHHYSFKHDSGDFLKTRFLQMALNNPSDALLYAIVAFSCYHFFSREVDESRSLEIFLQYYNKCIILLQQSLTEFNPGVGMLLTILQLATIEEFLGDWANLFGHVQAAHQILTDLFTPETLVQDAMGRSIAFWYIRFELFAEFAGEGGKKLNRDWFATIRDLCQQEAKYRSTHLAAKLEYFISSSSLLAKDSALLFAAKERGAISDKEFVIEACKLKKQYADFGHILRTSIPGYFVRSFPNVPLVEDASITAYQDPHSLYAGELFAVNYIWLDLWTIEMSFNLQTVAHQRQTITSENAAPAWKTCKMIEAMEYSGAGSTGALLSCPTSLAMVSLFLPRDEKHIGWCRRRFANVEQLGYIYPPALRQHTSYVWMVDVTTSWLPNSEECSLFAREVRDFIAHRGRM